MSETELKQCPFCPSGKGRPQIEKTWLEYCVQCKECGVETADYFVKEEAIDQWNTRTETEPEWKGYVPTIDEMVGLIDDGEGVTDTEREAGLVAALEAVANTKPSLPMRLNSASAMRMYERHCDAVNFANKALAKYRGER